VAIVAWSDAARVTRAESQCSSISTQILPYVAVNKDAFPNSPAERRWLHQIIPPAKTSTGFYRGFSSAISGFRSLCGQSSAAI